MRNSTTLTLEQFWTWLTDHPNCVVRAGTSQAVLYDEEDFHWAFGGEGPDLLLVQVMRGKRPVGELLIGRESIDYVQTMPGDAEEEFVFELISESENDSAALFFFVMAHGLEDETEGAQGRVH